MKNILIILKTLLIVGLMASLFTPPAFAGNDHAMQMSHVTSASMDEMAGAFDGMPPCHDGKMDCDKTCPCMTLCLSLGVMGLPSTVATVASLTIVGERIALSSEARLASLTTAPPARPPRG